MSIEQKTLGGFFLALFSPLNLGNCINYHSLIFPSRMRLWLTIALLVGCCLVFAQAHTKTNKGKHEQFTKCKNSFVSLRLVGEIPRTIARHVECTSLIHQI